MPAHTAQVITPFGQNLLRFVGLIAQDVQYADLPLIKSCVGLLGDLCSVPGMQQEIAGKVENKEWIVAFLEANSDVEPRTFGYAYQRLQSIGIA